MAFEPKIMKSKIFQDIIIFQPSISYDSRGTIFTSYDKSIYNLYLPNDIDFIHDKFAESKGNVLRGLHGDNKTWKLVTCIYGEIYQVAVDLRTESPTYLKWDSWIINSVNKLQILIPPNFVNGYYVLNDKAVFHYKLAYQGNYIDADDQITVKWNDLKIGIKWPCKDPILQERDK